MNRTAIEFCDYTWNPITGCRNACPWCWARRQIVRQKIDFEPRFHEDRLTQPFHTKKPSKIFAVSMGDMFSAGVEKRWQDAIWTVMECATWHTFLVLTKRPARLADYVTERRKHLPGEDGWGSNIWVGTSVTAQPDADERVPLLLQTPAAKRFVSVEPMLGPVDLTEWLPGKHQQDKIDAAYREFARQAGLQPFAPIAPEATAIQDGRGVNWVIVGGLTGVTMAERRPPEIEWIRSLYEQCETAGIPIFMKSNCMPPMLPSELEQEWPK